MYTKTVSVVYLKFKSPEPPVFYLATVSKDNSRREGQRDTGQGKGEENFKVCTLLLYFSKKRTKLKIAFTTHFLKAEIRLLLRECKRRCQAGVSDGMILNLRKSLAGFFCKKESWQVISADVAQLLFCTLKETIKMAGTLKFKELGRSYSEANFK